VGRDIRLNLQFLVPRQIEVLEIWIKVPIQSILIKMLAPCLSNGVSPVPIKFPIIDVILENVTTDVQDGKALNRPELLRQRLESVAI
jgi:hypothetical protein